MENRREILFRGQRWDNGEWLYGNIQAPKPPFNEYFMWDEKGVQHNVTAETVGQFSGILDKNGVKVFDGDIVTWLDYKSRDPYIPCDELMSVNEQVKFEGGAFNPICLMDSEEFEVVGNIFDNEDLLT